MNLAPSPASSCSRCARAVIAFRLTCWVCIRKIRLITWVELCLPLRLVAFPPMLGFFGKIYLFFRPGWADHSISLVVVGLNYFCGLDLLLLSVIKMMVVKEPRKPLMWSRPIRRSPGISLDAAAGGLPCCACVLIRLWAVCSPIPSSTGQWASRYADAAEGDRNSFGHVCCRETTNRPASGHHRPPIGAGGPTQPDISKVLRNPAIPKVSRLDDLSLTVESGTPACDGGLRDHGKSTAMNIIGLPWIAHQRPATCSAAPGFRISLTTNWPTCATDGLGLRLFSSSTWLPNMSANGQRDVADGLACLPARNGEERVKRRSARGLGAPASRTSRMNSRGQAASGWRSLGDQSTQLLALADEPTGALVPTPPRKCWPSR